MFGFKGLVNQFRDEAGDAKSHQNFGAVRANRLVALLSRRQKGWRIEPQRAFFRRDVVLLLLLGLRLADHNNSNRRGEKRVGRLSAHGGSVCVAVCAVSVVFGSAYGETPDISGTYWATEYHANIALVGGGELPLTAAGKEAYAKNIAGIKEGSIIDAARRYCVPDGLPRVLASPYPFEIFQAPPGQVTMVYELNHQVRVIAIDKPLPSEDELETLPYYNGHSVGHFEGDTLVVETAGFNEKTFVDATGAPHTDELRTVERIRRIGPTQLEDVITIHDPKYYTRDWQARFVYTLRNDVWLEDYVCGETHRDLSSVAGVRRR
ncbi:MAG TPA: hypothetical protein VH684_11730 [Xanthobacteraceae bacterium]|jgi:hypothetical protein